MRSFVVVLGALCCSWLLAKSGAKAEETAPGSSCSLCYDGSPSPFPDREFSRFDLFAFSAFPNINETVNTCYKVEKHLASEAVDIPADSKECGDYKTLGAFFCGCPAAPYDEEPSACHLCFGGAEPAEELLDFVLFPLKESPSITCQGYHAAASLPSFRVNASSGFVCDDLHWRGYKYCGCPRPLGDPTCDLDCDIPKSKWNDTAVKNPWSGFINVDWTCGDVDAFTRMTTGGRGCSVLALAANAGCGCPAPSREFGEEFTCPLCPYDDNLMPLASTINKRISFTSFVTCFSELIDDAALNPRGFNVEFCGHPSVLWLWEFARDVCCSPGCEDDPYANVNVALREKGKVTNCAGVAAAVNNTFGGQYIYCNSQVGKVHKKCKKTCSNCRNSTADTCVDANDSVTFPKMKIKFVRNVCRRLKRRTPKKIARICKDNRFVRRVCSKTCHPDFCAEEND